MADDFNNDSLLELYLYESTSLLDSLDDILLKAEAEGNLTSGNVNEIFRIMHTIKGSSAMMAYAGISEVSHKTEDLFAVIRSSGLNMNYFNELFDVVLAVSDFLKTEVSKIQEGKGLETEVNALTDIVLGLTGRMRESAPAEPKADLGRVLGATAQPQTAPPVSQPGPVAVSQPEPIGISQPEPMPAPAPAPGTYMPMAPEGGRILGIEPPQGMPAGQDELAADLSKITAHLSETADTPGGNATYYLHIHFNEGAKMENIRAFMLVNKLSEKGIVNRTVPAGPESNPDAANRIIERGFYVSYTTSLFREQIETLIKGTLSVETVSFVRKLPDDPSGAEAAPEPPKPEPRPQPIAPLPATGFAPPVQAPQPAQQAPPQFAQPQQQAPQQAQQQAQQVQMVQAPQPAQQKAPASAPQPQRPVFVDVTRQAPPQFAQPQRPVFVNVTQSPAPVQAVPGPARAAQADGAPAQEPPPAKKDGGQDKPLAAIPSANQSFISVELKKLDTLLDLVGEIVINESIVTENPDLEGLELTNFNKAARQLDKLTNELQDTVMSIRMLPISMVFQRMRRIVRDMGKNLGKEAELVLVGDTTEVDKTILDALSDPIMHLVRNAMDHALESPEERSSNGKNPAGHIILSAQNSGGDIIISVSDDGKGLDKNVILGKARANGLLRKPETEYSDREIFNLLMAPGFSTRDNVSEYSGRGVGLDVVKSNIEKIGGSVIIESKKGLGTNIIMKIPLTLAIISCIEVAIGNDVYSVPINNIRESFKSNAGQLITDPMGGEMIMLRGEVYPIVRLYSLFGRDDAIKNIADGILVLVETGDCNACLLADSLVGKFQVVVKPLPKFLNRFGAKQSGISGCTIMGNGNISLIVNVQDLVE
ncbi:MAG: chemotaxis protein CheW [Clostridiales Family XIII bacterium]|jgi:chemotaxis protein histidine kinase CheA|nr:chemotaxis protein CheW [Clostridiales Family XIII bacterium]